VKSWDGTSSRECLLCTGESLSRRQGRGKDASAFRPFSENTISGQTERHLTGTSSLTKTASEIAPYYLEQASEAAPKLPLQIGIPSREVTFCLIGGENSPTLPGAHSAEGKGFFGPQELEQSETFVR